VLARHLGTWSDERLAPLAAGAGPELLVVAGPAHALPWVDGLVFLGTDEDAPRLRLPTALAPSLPADLLQQIVGAGKPSPLAVLPPGGADGLLTIALDRLSRVDRAALARLAEGGGAS
jgi:hypothetical protein